jgi:DNA-binding response OmpR family regulator
MKILLVEDAPVVLEYETQILRRAGHTVRATDNGDTAAEHYDERLYDLVLTDLWHPGLEGHNLIKRILKKNPKQVIGVISATTVMEEEIDVPLMQKPFEPSDLLAFVDAIMSPRLPGHKKALDHVYGRTQYVISVLANVGERSGKRLFWGWIESRCFGRWCATADTYKRRGRCGKQQE